MPSPFPGMDPYLEHPNLWLGFHALLIGKLAVALTAKVAPRYYVAVEERTYVAAIDPETFVGRPDVTVIGTPHAPTTMGDASTTILERPVTVELPVEDQLRERYLEIREAKTHKVVTVIEILSPSNKVPGEGRDQYEEKRHKVLGSLTHLVEIDLLRIGKPMPMGHLPSSHYRILVSREWERFKAKLYPFNLNEPILEIPIPLRKGETEPSLALGELLTQVYDEARYDLRIDYTVEPVPPLDPASATWSLDLLRQTGRR